MLSTTPTGVEAVEVVSVYTVCNTQRKWPARASTGPIGPALGITSLVSCDWLASSGLRRPTLPSVGSPADQHTERGPTGVHFPYLFTAYSRTPFRAGGWYSWRVAAHRSGCAVRPVPGRNAAAAAPPERTSPETGAACLSSPPGPAGADSARTCGPE
eukprot:5448803-Pyramimonas_sp.AAC.3